MRGLRARDAAASVDGSSRGNLTDAMTASDRSRTALVTGAARGLGRVITRRLVDDGFFVWALDVDAETLDDPESAFGAERAPFVHTAAADVGNEAEVRATLARLERQRARLDLLVNNAGIADPLTGPVETLALADWERVLRANLTGHFLMVKHAVPLLRATRGCIVNMSSTRAFQSEANTEAYAASKGGVHALTHALAISLGPDIRVNAIAPGWIDVRGEQSFSDAPTPLRDVDHTQHPVGRVGCGDDIAGLVSFLAGDDARFITGQTLVADGGMTRRMIYEH